MIYDLHNDILTSCRSLASIKNEIQANYDLGIKTVYAVYTTELRNPVDYCKASSRIVPDGMFAIEDMGFINDNSLEEIVSLQPKYCGLTWNNDNILAGGALGEGSLTDFGKRVIKILDMNNICIDTAHLNRKSFWQVMESDPKRVICSHTAVDFINSHLRNLTKEQICAILLCGGIVGITFVSAFICAEGVASLDRLCDHIIAFVENFGEDGLALGTDFYGTAYGVEGLTDYSCLSGLGRRLLHRGLSRQTINKVFYLNALKFWST